MCRAAASPPEPAPGGRQLYVPQRFRFADSEGRAWRQDVAECPRCGAAYGRLSLVADPGLVVALPAEGLPQARGQERPPDAAVVAALGGVGL